MGKKLEAAQKKAEEKVKLTNEKLRSSGTIQANCTKP